MGFLTVNGMLMTYEEYKTKTTCYNMLGLMQFANLYNIHKPRQIEAKNLHWGEEIEYHLYHLDPKTKMAKLSCDAVDIMAKFLELSEEE